MDDDTFDLSEQMEEAEKGPEFQARYETDCESCGHTIIEGDPVRYDDMGYVVHSECA